MGSPDENGITPLHLACRSGWLLCAEILRRSDASEEARDEQGFSPLMKAVRLVQRVIVQLLLERGGFDVNAVSRWDGCRALHLAAFADDAKMTMMLLDKRASVHARSEKGSCLGIAATRNNMTVVETLLKPGANPNKEGFHIWEGLEMNDIRQNTQDDTTLTTSLLDYAASRKAVKLTRLLCASLGIVVDSRDKHGTTPLIRGSRYGNYEACMELLVPGADVGAESSRGLTPLLAAILSGTQRRF